MQQIFTLIFSVFVAIEAHKQKTDLLNSNHVNLSLETAFVFDPKDMYYDVALLRTVRSFLESLQNAITSKAQLRTIPKENYSLSDFLYELGGYIIKYTDQNIKTATSALKSVVEDYYPAGTIYHKIFYDPRLKAFIKNTLIEIAESDPKVVRAGLKAMYQGPTYEEIFVDLVDNLNCLYDETDDSKKFKKLVKRFEKFPSTKHKLERNIDKALNFIVFKRYKMLNFSMKSLVVDELSKVSEYVVVAFKNRSLDPEFFLIRKRTNQNNLSRDDFVSRNYKDFSGSEREQFRVNPNDSLERITKSSSEENEVAKENYGLFDNLRKNNDIPKEIVFDKAIEINVRKSGNDDVDFELSTTETKKSPTTKTDTTKTKKIKTTKDEDDLELSTTKTKKTKTTKDEDDLELSTTKTKKHKTKKPKTTETEQSNESSTIKFADRY